MGGKILRNEHGTDLVRRFGNRLTGLIRGRDLIEYFYGVFP